MEALSALRSVVKLEAMESLLASVKASILPWSVVFACAPAAIARAASPMETVPVSMALTQNDRPATAGARFRRFSKTAVTKDAVLPLPYRAIDSWLLPKLSIRLLTAGLLL